MRLVKNEKPTKPQRKVIEYNRFDAESRSLDRHGFVPVGYYERDPFNISRLLYASPSFPYCVFTREGAVKILSARIRAERRLAACGLMSIDDDDF